MTVVVFGKNQPVPSPVKRNIRGCYFSHNLNPVISMVEERSEDGPP